MFLQLIKTTQAACIFACVGSLFVSGCANLTEKNVTEQNVTTSVELFNAIYCRNTEKQTKLDLAEVSLTRQLDIPLMYQDYNNLEGPVWYDGALYYSNIGSHQADSYGFTLSNQTTIWRWELGNKPEVWLNDRAAGTNGLALDNSGNLIAARHLDGSISRIDWQTKQVTPIANLYNKKRFNSPNDLVIAHNNTVYFTDPNWNTPSNIPLDTIQGGGEPGSLESGQRVYSVSPKGQVTALAVTELVPELRDKPNGIMLSLDQSQLIVGGLQGLWVFDLVGGNVANPQRLLDTPIDGLGKDCLGNIYVTTTKALPHRTDGQVILVLSSQYQEIGMIEVEGIHIVTNIAFGGEAGQSLFVTGLTALMDEGKPRMCGNQPCLSAGIYTAELNIQGFPY